MNLLKKIKGSKPILIASAAVGALLIGVGTTNIILTPTYSHAIAGIDQDFDSSADAKKWIEENITEGTADVYVFTIDGYEYEVSGEDINDFLIHLYLGEHDTMESFYSVTATAGENGLVSDSSDATTVLVDAFRNKDGSINLDEATAIATYVETANRYFHALSGTTTDWAEGYSSEATAIDAWKDETVNTHTYNSQIKFEGADNEWFADEDAAKDSIMADHTILVEDFYSYSGLPGEFYLSFEIAEREGIAEETSKITTTGTDADMKWLWKSNEYTSHAAAVAAIEVHVDAEITDAPRYAYDGRNYDYTSETAARTAFRETIYSTSKYWYSHDGSSFDYESENEAKTAYRATLSDASAGATTVNFYHSGSNNYSTVEADVLADIAGFIQSKQVIENYTGPLTFDNYKHSVIYKYGETDKYFTSLDYLALEHKTILENTGAFVKSTTPTYTLKGTDLTFDSKEALIAFWETLVEEVKN